MRIDAARPNAGWEMKVWSNGPDKVMVSFFNEKTRRASMVEAYYKDGNPHSNVTEYRCSARWQCEER